MRKTVGRRSTAATGTATGEAKRPSRLESTKLWAGPQRGVGEVQWKVSGRYILSGYEGSCVGGEGWLCMQGDAGRCVQKWIRLDTTCTHNAVVHLFTACG
jgi:hypothetical protein